MRHINIRLTIVLLLNREPGSFDTKRECRVFMGKHNIQRDEPTQLIANIADFFIHPEYDPIRPVIGKDLALIKLAKPLKFNSAIQPICLPFGLPELPYNRSCYTTGWGRTKYGK